MTRPVSGSRWVAHCANRARRAAYMELTEDGDRALRRFADSLDALAAERAEREAEPVVDWRHRADLADAHREADPYAFTDPNGPRIPLAERIRSAAEADPIGTIQAAAVEAYMHATEPIVNSAYTQAVCDAVNGNQRDPLAALVDATPEPTRPCPDCRDGKHGSCNEIAFTWDDIQVSCPCMVRGHK